MPRLVKHALMTAAKLALAAGLVVWLLQSGRLDFRQLEILWTNPLVLASSLCVWLLAATLMGSLRWLLLLRGLGYRLSWLQAVKLQLIGFFFNVTMPGAVSGDIVKASYLVRENRELGKTPAMMSVVLDRVIGLFGLFTVGSIAILFQPDKVFSHPALSPMAIFLVTANLAGLLCLCTVFISALPGKDPIERLLDKPWPLFPTLKRIYTSFRGFQHHKLFLFGSWLISVLIQLLMFGYFLILTRAMIAPEMTVADLSVIFPIGILTTALPLAPAGMGVGHMAFSSLFKTIGITGGANVFNVYALSSMALSLVGALPFILRRGRGLAPLLQESQDG